LAQISKSASYPELMKKLIVQGLIKIEEQDVEIQCRAEDTKVVKDVLAAAVTEYTACMAAAGHKERGQKPNVKISATQIPSTGCSGGVLLTACNNRIVLNQTLDEYVDICFVNIHVFSLH
jgi:V-type H+-transporting ATPase subunit E